MTARSRGRVLPRDVLADADERHSERADAVDELVALAEEAGMYKATAIPRRTR